MAPLQINAHRFPTTWAQLYALSYGECCSLIESFLDDTIDRDELRGLYRAQSDAQHERVTGLVRQLSEELLAGGPPE